MSVFHTIRYAGEGLYKEKGSKFIARSFSVSSEEEVKNALAEVRKEYYDARHHCYAWVLGLSDQRVRSNDDGEPAHSAGDPILGQIKSHGLTNTLVVVVRYFGGIKLGVGGLIGAYKAAAAMALEKVERVQLFERVSFKLSFTYGELSHVERIIEKLKVEVQERNYLEDCKMDASIRKEQLPLLLKDIEPLYKVKIDYAD